MDGNSPTSDSSATDGPMPPPLPLELTAAQVAPAAPATAGGWWSLPMLAPMLRERRLAIAMSAFGALQVAAGAFHFQTFPCPMLHGLRLPCPACCASRACGA